jgi:hypothetical protein
VPFASRANALTGLLAAVFAAEGCAVNSTSDADRFREALPLQEDVALDVPGSGDALDARSREWPRRRNATGAGRSDWTFAGGDLPVPSVDATECWSASFARTYYEDTASYQPTTDDKATCAFSASDQ